MPTGKTSALVRGSENQYILHCGRNVKILSLYSNRFGEIGFLSEKTCIAARENVFRVRCVRIVHFRFGRYQCSRQCYRTTVPQVRCITQVPTRYDSRRSDITDIRLRHSWPRVFQLHGPVNKRTSLNLANLLIN